MPASLADKLLDLEELHAAILQNLGLVPGVEKLSEPLAAVIANIRTLSTDRNTLIANKQKVTQDLKAAVAEGTNLAINIRAIVRGEVGARSEKLVEFGVAPLRRRTRKSKPLEPEKQ